jgi:hypothetical protein
MAVSGSERSTNSIWQAVFRDSEDSWAAATLGRWLPGILPLEETNSHSPAIVVEPGVWARYRITVDSTKARPYVHGAAQPCLIVNDLQLGDSSGGVARWIGPATVRLLHNFADSRSEVGAAA